jgi:hypothetical protein
MVFTLERFYCRRIYYRVEKGCADADVYFLYYQLLNSVFIFKCVSKMINAGLESDDEDDNESKK